MNAAASVLGSVLAMVIAIQFGLTVTLACGAAAYLLALIVVPVLQTKGRFSHRAGVWLSVQRWACRGDPGTFRSFCRGPANWSQLAL